MWRVVARSGCSGTRSSGTRRTRACRSASVAGWSARSQSVSMSGRTGGCPGRARHAGSVDPGVSPRRVRSAGPSASGRSVAHAGWDVELAFQLKRERPERTAAQVREIMLATAGEGDDVPGLRTLQTHLAREGLNVRADGRSPGRVYGRFEAGARNELWTGDGLHGPVLAGGAARRAVLLAFIDDHSRLLVGWRWGTGEDVFRLEAALRSGLMSRGVPNAVLSIAAPRSCPRNCSGRARCWA